LRGGKPITTINGAGIPDTLLESEPLDYKRGSFSGANKNKAGLVERARFHGRGRRDVGAHAGHAAQVSRDLAAGWTTFVS
jgi:hypothetical protein